MLPSDLIQPWKDRQKKQMKKLNKNSKKAKSHGKPYDDRLRNTKGSTVTDYSEHDCGKIGKGNARH